MAIAANMARYSDGAKIAATVNGTANIPLIRAAQSFQMTRKKPLIFGAECWSKFVVLALLS